MVMESESIDLQSRHLLLLSARTASSLEKMCCELSDYLARHPEISLNDTAHTLCVGRHRFRYRRALVVASRNEAVAGLANPEAGFSGSPTKPNPPVILQIPANGPLLDGAAWQQHPVYLEAIAQCFDGLLPDPLPHDDTVKWFLQAYGLAELLLYLGLDPAGVTGRGPGELVAATVCGMLTPCSIRPLS